MKKLLQIYIHIYKYKIMSLNIQCNKNNSIKIFIYKIFCNDENIKDIYIGQTKNFEIRKVQHERDSKISDLQSNFQERDTCN